MSSKSNNARSKKPAREAFTISRALEYFSEDELTIQRGGGGVLLV